MFAERAYCSVPLLPIPFATREPTKVPPCTGDHAHALQYRRDPILQRIDGPFLKMNKYTRNTSGWSSWPLASPPYSHIFPPCGQAAAVTSAYHGLLAALAELLQQPVDMSILQLIRGGEHRNRAEYTNEILPEELVREAIREELNYFNATVWHIADPDSLETIKTPKIVRSRWV